MYINYIITRYTMVFDTKREQKLRKWQSRNVVVELDWKDNAHKLETPDDETIDELITQEREDAKYKIMLNLANIMGANVAEVAKGIEALDMFLVSNVMGIESFGLGTTRDLVQKYGEKEIIAHAGEINALYQEFDIDPFTAMYAIGRVGTTNATLLMTFYDPQNYDPRDIVDIMTVVGKGVLGGRKDIDDIFTLAQANPLYSIAEVAGAYAELGFDDAYEAMARAEEAGIPLNETVDAIQAQTEGRRLSKYATSAGTPEDQPHSSLAVDDWRVFGEVAQGINWNYDEDADEGSIRRRREPVTQTVTVRTEIYGSQDEPTDLLDADDSFDLE
jgi:hypothetical protein